MGSDSHRERKGGKQELDREESPDKQIGSPNRGRVCGLSHLQNVPHPQATIMPGLSIRQNRAPVHSVRTTRQVLR